MRPNGLRRWTRATVAAATIAGSLGLAACGGGSGGGSTTESGVGGTAPATTADAGSAPKPGGTLRWRSSSDEGCVDPAQVQLRPFVAYARQMVDSLTFQNEDGEIKPWLATDWTINDDATEFTFTIRDDVTFSDGTKLTPEIVKQNLDSLAKMGPEAPLPAATLVGYKGTTVSGDQVTVSFEEPSASFLQGTSQPALGMLSPATLRKSLDERCDGQIVGTGPFTFDSYTRNGSLSFKRRDGYAWAPESFKNRGNAYLDEIRVQFVPDGAVAVGMLQSGQVDYLNDIVTVDAGRLIEADTPIAEAIQPGFNTGLFTNVKSGPLSDVRVRQAVNLALNRDDLVKAGLSPIDTAAPGILSPKNPGFKDLSSMLVQDVEEAKRLLTEAGWVPGPDGVRRKDGKELDLQLIYYTPPLAPYRPMLELVQQQLAEVGVKVTLAPQTVAQAFENERKFNFDLSLNARTRCDPDVLADWFAGYSPELDELFAQIEAEPDMDKRNEIAGRAQEYAMENVYQVPTNVFRYPQAYSESVHGLVYDCANVPSMSEVWLD